MNCLSSIAFGRKSKWVGLGHSPKIQLTRMYFSDEMELLNSLAEDWTILLKHIRKREEMHFLLLHNNKNIIHKPRTDCDEDDLRDQTAQYQKELTQIVRENHQIEQEEKQILEKYEDNTTSFDGVIKLMSRVAANVIEITELNLEKIRSFDASAEDRLRRFKKTLINMLNFKEKLNIERFISFILDYSKGKMQVELLRFETLIEALEVKEFRSLRDIYEPKEKPKVSSLEKIRQANLQQKRKYSLSRSDREVKKKSSFVKQKTKYLDNLYGIMHLSKNQKNEDCLCIQQAKEKLFNDLLHRNRFNQEHIKKICQLEEEYQKKVMSFQQNLPILSCEESEQVRGPSVPRERVAKSKTIVKTVSKQIIVPESKSTQKIQPQPPVRSSQNKSFASPAPKKPKPPLAESIMFHQFLATEAENYAKCQDLQTEEDDFTKRKISITRSRFPPSANVRDNQDFPHIFNRTIQTQINDSRGKFDLITKEVSYEGKRRRLPDINRGTSFDNKFSLRIPKPGQKSSIDDINNIEDDLIRTNKRKERWFRQDKLMSQRTKVIMKNVQVGSDLNVKREDYFRKQQSFTLKDRKKTDSNLMESTAYCKKTLNKFLDTKLNVF